MEKSMAKNVSVSKLSAYAANPVKYCRYKGVAYNKSAALRGQKMHDEAGKGGIGGALVLWFVIILGVLAWFMLG